MLRPERLPDDVTAMGVHPPAAACHGHVRLLAAGELRALGGNFVPLDTRREERRSSKERHKKSQIATFCVVYSSICFVFLIIVLFLVDSQCVWTVGLKGKKGK